MALGSYLLVGSLTKDNVNGSVNEIILSAGIFEHKNLATALNSKTSGKIITGSGLDLYDDDDLIGNRLL